MKKFLIVLAALVMAFAACLFVGCEEDETPADSGNEPPAESETGEVTQEEWSAAFAAESFSNYVFEGTLRRADNVSTIRAEIAAKGSAVHMHIVQSAGGQTQECYYEENADGTFEYAKEGGEWVKRENDYFSSSTLLTYSSMFADQFGGAVYNAETKSYALPSVTVGEGSSAQTFSGGTIKFADKKIAELSYTAVQNGTAGTSQSVTILYSAYGSTSVTLPANYTDKTQTVSEAEWRAAFSADVFDNVSYTMKQGQPDEFYTVTV